MIGLGHYSQYPTPLCFLQNKNLLIKLTGTFVHAVEQIYKFEIEAETQEEALEKLDEDPFGYLSQDEPIDEQGLEIKEIEFDEDD